MTQYEQEYDLFSIYLYKIIVVGDEHVGKSYITAQSGGWDITNDLDISTTGLDFVSII